MGIIQRNADSGPVMQYENNATIEYVHSSLAFYGLLRYFLNKAVEFDARMRSYKQELEVIEENINSQNRSCLSPKGKLVFLLGRRSFGQIWLVCYNKWTMSSSVLPLSFIQFTNK